MAIDKNADFTPSIPDSEVVPTKLPYNQRGGFKFWAQKVIPLVYNDSLSYYEVLCKVVNYLNNVIQNVDNLNESVNSTNQSFETLKGYVNRTKDTLINTYNELQDYVNTYFDNLDVQEEINAKLDAMADSGELTNLLAPFIPDLVTQWLNNHVTPTSPVVDNTLSISGAAADAKVTGDNFTELKEELSDIYTEIDNGQSALSLVWTQSEYIKPSTGKTVASGNSFYSTDAFYPINKNAYKIDVNNIHAYSGISCSVAFYSSASDESFISCIETDNPVLTSSNIPVTANFMRFCHQTANNPTSSVSCVEYYFKRIANIEEDVKEVQKTADDAYNEIIGAYSTPTIIDVLVDKTTNSGKIPVTNTTGTTTTFQDSTTLNCTNAFSVEAEKTYIIAKTSEQYKAVPTASNIIAFYKSDKTYLDRIIGGLSPVFTTPQNAAYCIFVIPIADSVSDYIVENSEELHLPFDNKIFERYPLTSLFGKKWLVFGDSITDNNARSAGNYHDFIRAETGCVVINEGISGSGYYQTGGVKSIPSAISDYDGATPDLVTIMAGINDIMFAVDYTPQILPIGDYTDTGTTSLMGYVYAAYQALLTKFPLASYGIMSPLPEADYPQTDTNNSLKLFVAELRKFCEYYGIPFLDQYTTSPLRPWVSAYNQKYFSAKVSGATNGDGLHPNYYGHKVLYPRIREFIKTLL